MKMNVKSKKEIAEELMEAIGELDNDIIEDAEAFRKGNNKKVINIKFYKRAIAIAACVCICVVSINHVRNNKRNTLVPNDKSTQQLAQVEKQYTGNLREYIWKDQNVIKGEVDIFASNTENVDYTIDESDSSTENGSEGNKNNQITLLKEYLVEDAKIPEGKYDISDQFEEFPMNNLMYSIGKNMLSNSKGNMVVSPANFVSMSGTLFDVIITKNDIYDNLTDSETVKYDRHTLPVLMQALINKNTDELRIQMHNSLWINPGVKIEGNYLETLTTTKQLSIFRGRQDVKSYEEALDVWIKKASGYDAAHYLSDYFDVNKAINAVSTVDMEGKWAEGVSVVKENKVFYGVDKYVNTKFLKIQVEGEYIDNDAWTTVQIPLQGSGKMYIVIPKDNGRIQDILKNYSYSQIINGVENKEKKTGTKVVRIPQFVSETVTPLFEFYKYYGGRLNGEETHLYNYKGEVALFGNSSQAIRFGVNENGCGSRLSNNHREGDTIDVNPDDIVNGNIPFFFAVTTGEQQVVYSGVINKIEEHIN